MGDSRVVSRPKGGAIDGATTALVLLTSLNVVNYIDRYVLFGVQEQVKGEFALSDHQIGSLTLYFMIAYMGVSPLTGWLGDHFPRKPMIVVTALLMSLCNFFTASVHSYGSLNFRHAALGVGEASFGIFAPALLADFYADDQRNRVLTIFNIAIPVGAAIGFSAGGVIGQHYGWRSSFIASAVPGAVIGILIWLLMKEPKRVTSDPSHPKMEMGALRSLLTNKAYLYSIMGYAMVTFSLGGITAWIASFLQRVDGYSQAAAGGVMGPIIVIAGLGGTASGGALAQWWSKKTPKAMYYVPALSALLAAPPALLCFFGPRVTTVPSLAVAVFLVFLGTGPVNAATLNAVRPEVRSTAMAGQLLAIHLFGDMTSPALIGWVSDHSGLRIGLGVTLITFVLAGIVFFVGARYAPELKHETIAAA